MRWMFLFVLGLNLAYFGWEYSRSSDATGLTTVRPDVPAIVLLNELEQFKALQEGESQAGVAIADKPATEKNIETVEVADNVATQAQQADRCYTLGPFRKMDTLREFTRLIKGYVVNASFRSRDELERTMFRVYLGPFSDYKTAKASSKELTQKKIADQYVVAAGPRANSISMGHFKSNESAQKHANSIKKQGFGAKVEPILKNYKLYWLDYRVAVGQAIPESYFKTKLDAQVTRLDRTCN